MRARPSINLVWLALSPILGSAQTLPDQIDYELSMRYTPYADGVAVIDFGKIVKPGRFPNAGKIKLKRFKFNRVWYH